MDKKKLSERDICSKYITPAVTDAGWDLQTQIREEVSFTKGRIIVLGKLHVRGEQKRADYILYYKSNIPIAVKVDELMALCDQLKFRIQQASLQKQLIADALVAKAVA